MLRAKGGSSDRLDSSLSKYYHVTQTGPFKWERTDKRLWLLQNSLLPVQTWLRLMSLSRKGAAEVVVVEPFITGSVSVSEQTGSSRLISGRRVENRILAVVLALLLMSDSRVLSTRPHLRLWLSAVSLILFVLTC